MKLPFFHSSKEPFQQGQPVAVFRGRGCLGGIVLEPSKRKTRVRFLDESVEWVDNKKLALITDVRWRAEIARMDIANQILKK